jgi:outer membrane lipoprotein-sorting protein
MQNQYNRNLRLLLLLPLLLLVTKGGMAQEGFSKMKDEGHFRQKMAESTAETNSIASDFVQVKQLSFLEEEVKSKGKFYFRKENMLRWEYTEPFTYLIIFSHDSILIRNQDKTNIYDAASGRMFREINSIMLNMVNGTILDNKNFIFAYYESDQAFKLVLTPLDANMKEFLTEIHLFINKQNYTVDELHMIERSGDFTNIRFMNKRLNEDLPQHIFDLH